MALEHAVISQMLGWLMRERSTVLCQSTRFVMSLMPGVNEYSRLQNNVMHGNTWQIWEGTHLFNNRLLAYADANHGIKYKVHVCTRL